MSINWLRWMAPFAILASIPYLMKPMWGVICQVGVNHSHGGVCKLTLPSEIFAQIMTLLVLVAVYTFQAFRAGRFGFFSFVLNFIFTSMMIGVNSFAFLYEDMILGERFNPPSEMMIIFMIALFGWILSSVLFGLSKLLARTLPRWTAVAYMVGPAMTLLPSPGYLLGAVIFGAGLIGMGVALWYHKPIGDEPLQTKVNS
ncbi:hypothetical protein ACFYKX_09405 [Cytobacillus sp. FJAT-54145]|uniref:Uncharacterized protein n=1 Tax=Cytobacillus spartinae TaxID=3299023 RepID=A0ABW6KD49_9BACI